MRQESKKVDEEKSSDDLNTISQFFLNNLDFILAGLQPQGISYPRENGRPVKVSFNRWMKDTEVGIFHSQAIETFSNRFAKVLEAISAVNDYQCLIIKLQAYKGVEKAVQNKLLVDFFVKRSEADKVKLFVFLKDNIGTLKQPAEDWAVYVKSYKKPLRRGYATFFKKMPDGNVKRLIPEPVSDQTSSKRRCPGLE